MKNYCVLYNPLANNGKAEAQAHALSSILTDGEVRYVDLAALGSFYDFFVSCDDDCIVILTGGDGTLHNFVNETRGLNIKQQIWFYGAGSGNDFLKDIGKSAGDAPFDLSKYITDLPFVRIDGKERLFVNSVSLGIDGLVCEIGNRERQKTNKPINYTAIALRCLASEYKPRRASVTVDGVTKTYEKVWLAPACNGRYFGGGMMIAPEHDRLCEDGKITLVIAHNLSRVRILAIFPEIFKGTHARHTKYVDFLKGDEITVRFDEPCSVQIDGETITGVTEYTAYSRNAAKLRKADK